MNLDFSDEKVQSGVNIFCSVEFRKEIASKKNFLMKTKNLLVTLSKINQQEFFLMNHKIIGRILANHRIRSNLTQKAAAQKVGNINAQFISNIERGLCPAPLWILKKIIKIYQLKTKDVDLLLEVLAYCYLESLSFGLGVKPKERYILKSFKMDLTD